MKNKLTFTLFAFALFLFVSSHAQQECNKIQLVHGLAIGYPVSEAFIFIGQEFEKKSESSLQFEFYSKQQLTSEPYCIESLQIDGLDRTEISTTDVGDFFAKMRVLELSFVLNKTEYFLKVFDREDEKSFIYVGEKYWLSPILYC